MVHSRHWWGRRSDATDVRGTGAVELNGHAGETWGITTTSSTALLRAERIGRRSGDSGAWLFRQVDLELRVGETVAILGATGSGKSLLLRSLAMVDRLDEGELRWRGETVAASQVPSFRSKVVCLLQTPILFEGTAEENLRFPFSLKIHSGATYDPDHARSLLDSLGCEESLLAQSHERLSGGERLLVALLRALQLDPTVLLLDEPTAALDRDTAAHVESLLTRWRDDKPTERAIAWVTHDHAQARRVANRVLEFRQGNLQRSG